MNFLREIIIDETNLVFLSQSDSREIKQKYQVIIGLFICKMKEHF